MAKPEEEENLIDHLTAGNGWKVFTQRARKPAAAAAADDEVKSLLREMKPRRDDGSPRAPDEPDDTPGAA